MSPYTRGRRSTKKLNGWGKAFEATLILKRMTYTDAVNFLTSQPHFSKLNRGTLYRWGTIPQDEVSPRAHAARNALELKPTITASDETLNQWMEKLTRITNQFDTMKAELRILVAQLSFHKSK